MKKTSLFIILLIFISGCVSSGRAGHQRVPDQGYYQPDLEVFIIDDRGGRFPFYPVDRSPALEKAYIEAHEGEHYSIEVINRSDQRIGVVIAVDGRNIVSGKYSKLRHKEDMYVLEPNERELFDGWRSARDRINRFYFTDAGNSYSASFNDYSAMGVIAVAAFQERLPKGYRNKQDVRKRRNYSTGPQSAQESAGTGWGHSGIFTESQGQVQIRETSVYNTFNQV